MKGFKVGNYVVFKDNPNLIHKVIRFVNDNQVYAEFEGCGVLCHRIIGVALIRLCTNLDYIHTLNTEQMAKFVRWACDHVLNLSIWLNQHYDGWEVK